MALYAEIRSSMESRGTSFKEAMRELFSMEMLALNVNREVYTTFCTLSSQLDLILETDYINGMAYIERKHHQEQKAAKAAMESKQPTTDAPPPPPPPAKGKRSKDATAVQAKRRKM